MIPRDARFRILSIAILLSLASSVVIGGYVHGALVYEPEDYELKPGQVQHIGYNDIPPEESDIFRYTLNSSLNYRVFLSGEWVEDINETARTDYDLYVYNPLGAEEVSRTDASAIPEHLGSSGNPFYTPEMDGLYTFMVVNDESESLGAQNATLMVIEHLEVDRWYRNKLYMRGKDSGGEDTFFTTWAYEFVSSEEIINILVEVPNSLDMYEMRLFLMANLDDDEGYTIAGAPVPPSEYLLGEYQGNPTYGGYNAISTGFRGEAFTSAPDFGVDMSLQYDSGSESEKLYYLVFIAEEGAGNIDFIINTDRTAPELSAIDPVDVANANEFTEVRVYANDNESGVDRVTLSYTVDDWLTSEGGLMAQLEENIYTTSISGQAPGTRVDWRVTAMNEVDNSTSIEGGYSIKMVSEVTVSADPEEMEGSIPVSVSGTISPAMEEEEITIQYINELSEQSSTVVTDGIGEFSDQFIPDAAGTWEIKAIWVGGDEFFPSEDSTYVVVESSSSALMIFSETERVKVGDEITISGTVNPPVVGAQIIFMISYPTGSQSKESSANAVGEFTKTFTPDSPGTWEVTAEWAGSPLVGSATSNTISFTVARKGLNIYMIGGGVAVVIVAAVVTIVVLRRRRGGDESTEDEDEYLFE